MSEEQQKMMPGRYTGTIVDCDSGVVGANKAPLVKLFFKLKDNGKVIPWTGWFSDKVNQKTGKTYTELLIEKLLECGFTGKCTSDMAGSPDINTLFNTEKEWNLDVDYQTDKNGANTEYFEVQWINDPEKTGTKLDKVEAVQVFRGMNISGMIANARKQMPVDVKKVKETQDRMKSQKQQDFASDDIPF